LNIFLRLDQHAASRNLLSQTYSVIPLGEKVGMIEWVQNMTELFSIYRKWQQQEQTLEQLKQNHHGLSLTLQRKHWPIRMLCDVFNELSSQVPADLFSRALWMTAVDSPVWWRNVTEYTRSLAVMSIAGYILGLGDRHLDNIMVNLQTGTILHIDYNVCFDKGTQLKIPETVPFRLTRNLEHAMGPLAKMGSFRISSENVLDVMRKRSDELLLLLEDSLSTP
ncbi:kinase-like domain-containing protein, partial [Cladochytrium replicatum]